MEGCVLQRVVCVCGELKANAFGDAGVGENPEFQRKKAARDRRRKMKKESRMDGQAKLKLSDDGFSQEDDVLNSINTWSDDSFSDSEFTSTELTEDEKSP